MRYNHRDGMVCGCGKRAFREFKGSPCCNDCFAKDKLLDDQGERLHRGIVGVPEYILSSVEYEQAHGRHYHRGARPR